MRILFLNSIGKKKWGGGEKWMLMAAAGLARNGHQVFIGCAKNSIIRKNAEALALPILNISFNSDFDLPGFIRLLSILKKYQITHLVCGQNKDSKIGAIAARCTGGVAVLARHGLQLISKKFKYKYIFSHLVDGIITNSASIKQTYDAYGWFKSDFVKVIHNGFTPPQNVLPFDYKKQFNLPNDAIIIISAGRLAQQKGLNILLKTAEMASQDQKNWFFFIAGKGKLENKLKQMTATKKLTDKVRFLGFIENVLPYVQGADLFVLPSFYEGMPNAVMEAMGLGKCCVVTSVNGNNELIDNEKEGILVQPHDARALYNGICQVAENAAARQLMGKNALAKMRNSFSEDKMINELEAFLKRKSKYENNN